VISCAILFRHDAAASATLMLYFRLPFAAAATRVFRADIADKLPPPCVFFDTIADDAALCRR